MESIAAPVIGSVVGGLLGGSSGGGQTVQDRSPWGPAQPWLQNNITSGQALQNQYLQNPFSPQQQTAYNNAFSLSDAYRSLLPGLIQSLNTGQFDRTNPLQRPQAMQFSGNPFMAQKAGGYQAPKVQYTPQPAQQAAAVDPNPYVGNVDWTL